MEKAIQLERGMEVVAVGVDLGDRYSHWCALSPDGEVFGRGRVATTVEAVSTQAEAARGARVAIENGTHSGWFSRALAVAGCVVTVANHRAGAARRTTRRPMRTTPSRSRGWCGSIRDGCIRSSTGPSRCSRIWPRSAAGRNW